MDTPKILLVDDEPDILEFLSYNLRKDGFEVRTACDGRKAIEIALEFKPHLVLLDVMMPEMDGIETCEELRKIPELDSLLIAFLTARGEDYSQIAGFEAGADDYITKPFSMRELVLRIRAVLRRNEVAPTEESLIEFGNMKVDREAHRVWVEGEEIELTALEFKLLVTLYERRNRVQTRSSLLDHVWGIDTKISTRTVDAHVKRLREKLGAARDYIETVRGVGYRFADAPLAAS